MEEQFRVFSENDKYEVSNFGRVMNSKTERILKQQLHRGYYRVTIGGVKWPIHRMVALTWFDNPENKPAINHKDGVKTNNKVDNLEWCTHRENMEHAYETGIVKSRTYWRSSERAAIHLLSQSQHYDVKKLANMFLTTTEQIEKILSEPFDLHLSNVGRVYNEDFKLYP